MIDQERRAPPPEADASWRRTLDDEVRALRALLDRVGVDAIAALRDEVARLRSERDDLAADLGLDDVDLGDGGPARARARVEAIALNGRAVTRPPGEPSTALTDAIGELVRRAYDAEAERALLIVQPATLVATVARLSRTRDALDDIAAVAGCSISTEYHRARIDELHVTSADLAEREQRTPDDVELVKALHRLRSVRTSLLREKALYERICRTGDAVDAATAATKLTQLAETLRDLAANEAELRQGGPATGRG